MNTTRKISRIRERQVAAASLAMAAFALYASCVAPTLSYGGDCGELIAASYRLGIAHPTGYPLYCLLGRLFASICPFGEVAWRYNVLSALMGATAVGLVTATVHRLTNPGPGIAVPERADACARSHTPALWPALGAGLLLAGFRYFGSQCVLAEVYALNGLMLSALIYSAVVWHQSGDWRWAYTVALLFGMALTAHLSCVFLAPGLFVFTVVQHRRRFGPTFKAAARRGAIMLAFLLAAYALTLYLPLRSAQFPEPKTPEAWWPLDWTHPADASRWLAHITARQYKFLLFQTHAVPLFGHELRLTWFTQPMPVTLSKLATFFSFITLQYLWFTPLLIVGAIGACRGHNAPRGDHADDESTGEQSTVGARGDAVEYSTGGRWLGAMLLLTFVLNVGVQIHYNVGDMANFFFPAYLVMAIWMGLGLASLSHRMSAWSDRIKSARPDSLWPWRLTTASRLVLLGTVAIQWGFFLQSTTLRGVTAARDTALKRVAAAERLALQSQQRPSLLLMSDDALWGFWYARYVLGRARQTATPWGPSRNKIVKQGRLVDLVADLQRTGPVALSQWDAAVDRRFPYVMLASSGNLCLASRRVLPPPAMPTAMPAANIIVPHHGDANGLIRARFLRRDFDDGTDQRADGHSAGQVKLKREDLAPFEVVFKTPFSTPLPASSTAPTVDEGSRPPAMHVGWIEVLVAQDGHFQSAPPPAQGNVHLQAPGSPPLIVWKQARRLIVPRHIEHGATLRAVVPLQMESDARLGAYHVWTRLTRSTSDAITPWRKVEDVQLTAD
jgi:Protein of unknown function (DUF2723)